MRDVVALSRNTFGEQLGLRWDDPQTVRLDVRPELINNVGLLLGPVVFSLVDFCMSTTMWAQTTEDERIATVNVSINFVDSAGAGEIVCRSHVERRTRRIGAVRSEVHHEDGRLLASAVGTFAISPARA